MTSIALSNYGISAVPEVRTTAVVVDRRIRVSSRDASLARSIQSYYVTKLGMVAGAVSFAMMAGAFIGRL